MLLKVRSFLRAIWSFWRLGDVPIEQYKQRQAACITCPYLETTRTGRFCRKCGCPRSALSDLRTKWRMTDIKCPIGRWEE